MGPRERERDAAVGAVEQAAGTAGRDATVTPETAERCALGEQLRAARQHAAWRAGDRR